MHLFGIPECEVGYTITRPEGEEIYRNAEIYRKKK